MGAACSWGRGWRLPCSTAAPTCMCLCNIMCPSPALMTPPLALTREEDGDVIVVRAMHKSLQRDGQVSQRACSTPGC